MLMILLYLAKKCRTEENTEALWVASMEGSLEENIDTNKKGLFD
jgi:hypothetical protein